MSTTLVDAFGAVGPQWVGDGSVAPVRLDKTGNVVLHTVHGKYFEAAGRGAMFVASQAVGGVAPGTALDDAPALALWNPPGSGVLCVIQRVSGGYISGTLGAGTLVHAVNPSQRTAPTTGTEIVPTGAFLGNMRSKTRAYTLSTVSATVVILRPSLHLGAALATTVTFPAIATDEVNGSIVIPPAGVWAYHGVAAAGTTPLTIMSVLFEEIPIV